MRSVIFPRGWLDPAARLRSDPSAFLAVLERGVDTPERAAFESRLQREKGCDYPFMLKSETPAVFAARGLELIDPTLDSPWAVTHGLLRPGNGRCLSRSRKTTFSENRTSRH